MNYVILGITAVLCIVMAYFVLDEEKASKIVALRKLGHGEAYENVTLSKRAYWAGVICFSVMAVVASYFIAMFAPGIINKIRLSIALLCLTGAAANDLREHRIPNIFPIVMVITGISCLVAGFLTAQPGWLAYISSCTIACVATGVCLFLAYFISGHGIGMGDIKILSALGLMAGVYTICSTIFFAVVTCTLISVVLLIFFKKKFKDAVPFGPFIFLGYVVSIVLAIY